MLGHDANESVALTKKFIRRILIIIGSVAFGSSMFGQVSFGQSTNQTTYGNCSPGIADVNGNVTLNCNLGNNQIEVPLLRGEVDEGRAEEERDESFMEFISPDQLAYFLEEHEDRIVYIDIDFDISDVDHNCKHKESKGNRDMCLDFYTEYYEGSHFFIKEFWEDECEYCIPCSHGRCEMKGFFISNDSGESTGYIYGSMTHLAAKDVLLNPKYGAPK